MPEPVDADGNWECDGAPPRCLAAAAIPTAVRLGRLAISVASPDSGSLTSLSHQSGLSGAAPGVSGPPIPKAVLNDVVDALIMPLKSCLVLDPKRLNAGLIGADIVVPALVPPARCPKLRASSSLSISTRCDTRFACDSDLEKGVGRKPRRPRVRGGSERRWPTTGIFSRSCAPGRIGSSVSPDGRMVW